MPTKPDTKAIRGTKHTCSNEKCGKPFYDLNRDPIVCPICQTTFVPVKVPVYAAAPARGSWRVAPKKPIEQVKPEPVADDLAATEDLPAVEGEEVPEVVEEEEDTFLQEVEEDSANVADIIDAPIEPDEKGS